MEWGLLLTGTRGAGKTTLGRALLASSPGFLTVPAITTRPRREDDPPRAYTYLSEVEFLAASVGGELLIATQYGSNYYGILRSSVTSIIAAGRVPILTVTPEVAASVVARAEPIVWVGVFVDAYDNLLDLRLAEDRRPATELDIVQRARDRGYDNSALFTLRNNESVEAALSTLKSHVERVAGRLP